MNKALLSLALLLPACDAAEPIDFREAQSVSAKVESIDYARKLLDGCFADESESVIVRLAVLDGQPGFAQEFVLVVEGAAPSGDLACAWSTIEGWQ